MWKVIKQHYNTKETCYKEEKIDNIVEEEMGVFPSLKKAVEYKDLLQDKDKKRESYPEYTGLWNTLYVKED